MLFCFDKVIKITNLKLQMLQETQSNADKINSLFKSNYLGKTTLKCTKLNINTI